MTACGGATRQENVPNHIPHKMRRLWAGIFIVLMWIANAKESSKLDEVALRPTALNSYNVHMKNGLRLGKLKQYRLSFYHFSRAALVARTDQGRMSFAYVNDIVTPFSTFLLQNNLLLCRF